MIGTAERDGQRVLTLASERVEAAFAPEAGMVCCSLRDRGEELLGQRHGLRGYVEDRSTMGIPLLYPWANRLSRDRFELLGREVDLGAAPAAVKRDANGLAIHGLLTASGGWELIGHESIGAGGGRLEARFDLGRFPELVAAFPFPHSLTITAAVEGGRLSISTTVTAGEGGPVPVGFGFHPYLTVPGLERSRWRLELPLREQLALDERGIPTGERRPVEPLSGALGERGFDDLYLSPSPSTPLALVGGGRRLELRMDPGYPFTQVYAPPGAALLAIEPMTAATDALASGAAPTVAAGGSFAAAFTITVADTG